MIFEELLKLTIVAVLSAGAQLSDGLDDRMIYIKVDKHKIIYTEKETIDGKENIKPI